MKEKIRKLIRKVFVFMQRFRINILPNHFYSNIPDFASLEKNDSWKKPLSMAGINGTDIEAQYRFLKECVEDLQDKSVLENFEIITTAIKAQNEHGFGPIEADFLFCFINSHQPKKIIQIGCGVSTSIILRAANQKNYPVELICVEPYPSEYLIELNRTGQIHLIQEKAQLVSIENLTDLGDGDLLFVDSTHTVKVGSEVNTIILEVLPRLKKGVFVHFHDIYFPYDYQRNIDTTLFFWNESTLLHAFLVNNHKYTIRCSQSMLHYQMKESLKKHFPNYNPQEDADGLPKFKDDNRHFPSSTYLQVI